jgi:hypothetical protein
MRFLKTTKWHPEKPSSYVRITPDEMLSRYQELIRKVHKASNGRHEPYFEYVQEALKVFGPQGGTFPLNLMMESLERNYRNAERSISITGLLAVGREFLLRCIYQTRERVGVPQSVPITKYATNAALPTGLKKGSFLAESEGNSGPWRHVWPDLLGQRHMRGKPRVIHQDSILNVRYVEGYLTKVRYWLRKYLPQYFGSWLNPQEFVRPTITRTLNGKFYSIETDYEKMDEHFSLAVALEMVLPVYEALLDEGEYLRFAAYIEESFNQPVYMGDYMLTGLHNLFSGQGITNDFETIFSVELALGGLLEGGCSPRHSHIIANGDDIALLIENTKQHSTTIDPQKIMDSMVKASEEAGLAMSQTKCRLSDSEVRFCRHVYYPTGRRNPEGIIYGAYPSVYALNNIVQPERPSKTAGLCAIADLSRLDNVIGSPDYYPFCDLIKRFTTHAFTFSDQELDQAPVDWWERVYGERWSPESSPSYCYLTQKR